MVEFRDENMYTDPVLYSDEIIDDVNAMVLGISVLNVEAYIVLL
jgi:hypothetical protein